MRSFCTATTANGRFLLPSSTLPLTKRSFAQGCEDLYPELPRLVVKDLIPLLLGNIRHIDEVRKTKREPQELDHREVALCLGRGFSWLHTPNRAIINRPVGEMGDGRSRSADISVRQPAYGKDPGNDQASLHGLCSVSGAWDSGTSARAVQEPSTFTRRVGAYSKKRSRILFRTWTFWSGRSIWRTCCSNPFRSDLDRIRKIKEPVHVTKSTCYTGFAMAPRRRLAPNSKRGGVKPRRNRMRRNYPSNTGATRR